MGNEQHGERLAALETEMKNVKEAQKTIFAKLDEQTKQIYKAIGGMTVIILVAELLLAFLRH